jgi:Na+/melibiose symporter-like transporter
MRYALVLAIIMVIGMFIMIPGTKEDKDAIVRYLKGYEESEKLSFWKVLNAALTSKNYMLQLFAYTMFMITANLFMANMFYFIKDVLKLPAASQMPVLLAYIVLLYVSVPIWVRIAKKIGPIKVAEIGLMLIAVGLLVNLIVVNLIMFVLTVAIVGIFWGAYLSMYMAIQSDAYDEVTIKCGCHQEATLLGISNFFVRVSYLVIAVIIAVVHIATGYNPNPDATQTPTAILGIRLLSSVFPAIFAVIGGIALILWYDLKGQKLMEMKSKLNECGL